MYLLQCCLDRSEEIIKLFKLLKVRVLRHDGLRAPEEEARLRGRIIARSLWLSPAAIVSNPQDWSALTVVSFDCSQRILYPVISPFSTLTAPNSIILSLFDESPVVSRSNTT